MTIREPLGRGFELATDAQFRELSNLATPPRAGRVTAIEASGQVRVECDDPDGGDVLAWPLNGFSYAVDDVVYIAFAVNAPDSALVIGSRQLPSLDEDVLDPVFVRVDGTLPLAADWIAGALRAITIGTLLGSGASGGTLTLKSTAHATKGKVYFGAALTSAYDEVNDFLGIGDASPVSQIESIATGSSASRGQSSSQHNSGAQAAIYNFRKSRGSRGSPSIVSNGDFIGDFIFQPYDGGAYIRTAQIAAKVNGTPGSGSVATDIVFAAGAADDPNITNERLRALGAGGLSTGGLSSIGASQIGVKAGGSTNDAAVGGVLFVTVGAVGQVGAGPDTLASYSVPANTLSVNNMSLWWRASGVIATTATSGTIVIKFGATTLLTINASPASGGQWWAEGEIFRTGATAQRAVSHGQCNQGATVVQAFGDVTPVETLSGAVTFAVTGDSTSAANNDTVLHTLKIGWDDANT